MVARHAYPRTAWTDTRAAAPDVLIPSAVLGLAVHWLGPAAPPGVQAADRDAVARYLRGVRRFHMGKGWSDIAYQWAVDQSGDRWRLRGWRLQSAANGDVGPNRRYGAVLALLGQGQHPSRDMLLGLCDAVDDWVEAFPNARRVATHNAVRPEPTACPGPDLTKWVHAGCPRPRTDPGPTPVLSQPIGEDDEMTIIVNPSGRWFHAVGGNLVALSRDTAASTADDAANRVVIRTDDATWKRYTSALKVHG